MADTQVFTPNDKPLNLRLLWWSALTLPIVIPSVWFDFSSQYLVPEACVSLALVLLVVLPARVPESISVSVGDHMLKYCYYNCWGMKREVELDVNQALAEYRHTPLTRLMKRCKLMLHANASHQRRHLTISEDSKGGFSKEQIDQITHLLEECGADCHLCKSIDESQHITPSLG
jgi:hypothetical protein